MSRFLRVFFVTGIPFGMLMAHSFASGAPTTPVDFALTALGSGVIFGCVLGTLAWTVTRRRSPSTLRFLSLWAVLSVAGIIVAEGTFLLGDRLPHGLWVRLSDPPETLRAFAGPTCYDGLEHAVYATAASGKLYSYYCPSSQECAWKEVREIPVADPGSSDLCAGPVQQLYPPPRPPRATVASYEVYFHGVDCAGQWNYVLLKDGSVWQWDRGMCAINWGVLVFFILPPAAIGLALVGCGSLLILKKRGGWGLPPEK